MRQANRFQKQTGCYKCVSCGRLTRSTGGDNDNTGTCAECYELGGIENEISDCGATEGLLAEVTALKATIARKGGKLI